MSLSTHVKRCLPKKLEEATQVGEDEKETKVKKMLSIVSKEVCTSKRLARKPALALGQA